HGLGRLGRVLRSIRGRRGVGPVGLGRVVIALVAVVDVAPEAIADRDELVLRLLGDRVGERAGLLAPARAPRPGLRALAQLAQQRAPAAARAVAPRGRVVVGALADPAR